MGVYQSETVLSDISLLKRHTVFHFSRTQRAPVVDTLPSDPLPEGGVGQRPSILVVDDARVNRLLLSRMLGELDVTVSTANDGEEAVGVCRAHKYSAILMDMCMVRCSTTTVFFCFFVLWVLCMMGGK